MDSNNIQVRRGIILRTFLCLVFTVIGVFVLHAQQIQLQQTHDNGLYQTGEPMRFIAHANGLSDSVRVVVVRNYVDTLLRTSFAPTFQGEVFSGVFTDPTSIMVFAAAASTKAQLGALVAPDKVKPGSKRPKDFKAFWRRQRTALNDVPINARLEPQESTAPAIACYDVTLDCLGPKPVRGYLAMPEQAEKGSLPIVILMRAAGVAGNWCQCQWNEVTANAQKGHGAISFDMNAHGMETGQPQAFYDQLEKTALKAYWDQGVKSREEYYFLGMYLRVMRALDYLTTLPEWDGRRILVIGESQGGGQAVAAAGLDKRVTALVLNVPAMQDFGGTLAGRRGGWPQPVENHDAHAATAATATTIANTAAAHDTPAYTVFPYFDGAFLLKGSKAEVIAEVGLVDMVCPAMGIYATLNGVKGDVKVNTVPYRDHTWPGDPTLRPQWEKQFLQQRLDFIDAYLR